MSRLPTIAVVAVLAVLALSATAQATPCGADRCRSFSQAQGAVGGIVNGPDGNLWFAGQGFVGRMSVDGQTTKFAAPVNGDSGVATGADGVLWFTAPNQILRVGLDGVVTAFGSGAGVPGGIVAGPDGALWYTGDGFVGRITTEGEVSRFRIPGNHQTNGQGSIAAGADGAVWFTLSGGAALGRVTADGRVGVIELPSFGGTLGGIAAGPDGGLWFTAPDARQIGRISTSTGHVLSFRVSQYPDHITAGPSYSIWFTMASGRGAGQYTVVRMVPAGFKSFFQIKGAPRGIGVGVNQGIFMTKGDSVQRLTPFLGAYPIRTRALRVSFVGSILLRLYCPKFDNVFCAGRITLERGGQVIGGGPFSQRVNDAPATRLLLNARGRALMRRTRRARVTVIIAQHDGGGASRRRVQSIFLKRHGSR